MAKLFLKQTKEYAAGRPSYPQALFDFIASKTPARDLAWDVGTGSGQAAQSLAGIYKNVIATDTSATQLECAPKLPNIRYAQTSPTPGILEIEEKVATRESVDLVTVAQALHWFDLQAFYQNIRCILKKPDGIIAAWCYTLPETNPSFDAVLLRLYEKYAGPYWDVARKMVDDKYKGINFPFEAVSGEDHTGPFEFAAERTMELDEMMTYLRSWSAYQTAKDEGVELLGSEILEEFKKAWNEDGEGKKVVRIPIYLRIGKIAPDWSRALSLKKVILDPTLKDGVIGIGIAATAVALIVGGIVASALARKN